jgi:hypothetical protein
MSRLDMTDILLDTDFVTRIQVARTLVTVNNDGLRVQSQPQLFANVVAIVTMADDLNLLRQPEGERLDGSITIHTRFRLTDGKTPLSPSLNADADIVTYQGRPYTVASVGDWSQWGQGFIMAVATLTKVNP